MQRFVSSSFTAHTHPRPPRRRLTVLPRVQRCVHAYMCLCLVLFAGTLLPPPAQPSTPTPTLTPTQNQPTYPHQPAHQRPHPRGLRSPHTHTPHAPKTNPHTHTNLHTMPIGAPDLIPNQNTNPNTKPCTRFWGHTHPPDSRDRSTSVFISSKRTGRPLRGAAAMSDSQPQRAKRGRAKGARRGRN